MDNPLGSRERSYSEVIKNHTVAMHKKTNLAEKNCPVCNRPFAWRRKWAKDWNSVRYCSERCRRLPQARRQRGRNQQ